MWAWCRGDPPRDGAGSYDFAPWETGAHQCPVWCACTSARGLLSQHSAKTSVVLVQSSSHSPTQPGGCNPTAASSWWALHPLVMFA